MKRRKYKYALLLTDWFVVIVSFGSALLVQAGFQFTGGTIARALTRSEFLLFIAFSPIVMYIFQSSQLYKIHVQLEIWNQARAIVMCLVYSSVAMAIAMFVVGELWVASDARLVVLYFLGASIPLMMVERLLIMRSLFRVMVKYKLARRHVLVVGAGDPAKISGALGYDNAVGLSLVGFLDDDHPIGTEIIQGKRVLGRIGDVGKIVDEHQVDEILLCLEGVPEQDYLNILDHCARTSATVMIGSDQFSVITQYVYNEYYGGMPVFGVMNSVPYFGAPVLKRVGDIILSFLALLFLAPLMLIIAVAVKLDSRGPVLFKQIRIGKDGKPFMFLKFRSMVVGSDNDSDRVRKLEQFIRNDKADNPETTKIVDTKKITRVGRFIRRTSLDELPQLYNVLRGEMSLVGPRPCLPYEWENYDEWHKRRLSVTPGCTGVWQVFGRSKVGFRDTVIIDLFYLHNMSFRLDMWLVLKTIPVMLFGDGGK